ncbi:aldo/keto reductase [Chytridium lagenaria]|nr:aldo/keto reductase [Chytridium lagenaria]
MSVPQVQIHPAGPEFSQMAYGIWRLDDGPEETKTPESILERIQLCLDLGITTFDAADIYGGKDGHVCETLFGAALRLDPSIRSRMQIISKTGIRCLGVSVKHYDLSKDYIVGQVKESIAAMGCGYLDLVLIHRPSPLMNPDTVAEAFRVLEDNFTVGQMDLLQSRLEFPLVTNQIELHPLRLEPLHDGILDHLLRHRTKPMAWSPLAGVRPAVARVQTRLQAIATELGADVTVDQVAYAWIMAHPSQPIPVLGTNSLERIQSAAKAFEIKLSLEQWFSIWEATAGNEVP